MKLPLLLRWCAAVACVSCISSIRAGETILLNEFMPARALIPSSGALGTSWTGVAFNDSSWTAGATAIGYDTETDYDSLIGLNVAAQMHNVRGSVYVRVPFTVQSGGLAGLHQLTLRMKYDDAFVAYINGTRVTVSTNAPPTPAWDSLANGNHPDSEAVVFEDFDVTPHLGLLNEGNNVLAIHGLNVTPDNSDLLILPQLVASDVSPPVITSQPQSRVDVVGTPVTFSVVASGAAPLTYRWHKDDGALTDGGRVSGAASPTLSLASVQFSDAGAYSVVVTDANASTTSSSAILTVIDPTRTINWSTLDGGGGGTSTGVVFAVRGTIGQLDAGRLINGKSTINGGFWGGLAVVQTPGAPLLSITLTTTNSALISWPSPSTGFDLQQNTDLATTNWVAPAESVNGNGTIKYIIVNPPASNRYFRLVKGS